MSYRTGTDGSAFMQAPVRKRVLAIERLRPAQTQMGAKRVTMQAPASRSVRAAARGHLAFAML
jgi:hypothetical protein